MCRNAPLSLRRGTGRYPYSRATCATQTRHTLLLATAPPWGTVTDQPRADREALAKFHNGATLDNIPVLRLPPTPQLSKRRGLPERRARNQRW